MVWIIFLVTINYYVKDVIKNREIFKNDYDKLKQRLLSIPDKITHEIMVN